jgi:ubiquinone/menaquinone biosynthesis C-methylase UbiE
MWSKKRVNNYLAWIESPEGRFALRQEKKLLNYLISPWPRRKQTLVDLGCGPGTFLNFFWKAGFEVHGVDKSQNMLKQARERTRDKIPLTLADLEHLPFEDNEFDFGALILVLEFTQNPEKVLQEACRIVKKGLILASLNKYSLYYLQKGFPWPRSPKNALRQARWYSWLEIKKMCKHNLPVAELTAKSTLPGTTCLWKNRKYLRPLHYTFLPPWLGSFIGLRIDFFKMSAGCHPLLVTEKSPCPPC